MADYVYTLQMQVRDYELDSEGIVNNANYLHYLEHTRHRFCAENGISFAEMQRRGIIPVLNKVEIEYKEPLRSFLAVFGWSVKACVSFSIKTFSNTMAVNV